MTACPLALTIIVLSFFCQAPGGCPPPFSPPNSRPAGHDSRGRSIVELDESIPRVIPPGRPFSGWMLIPVPGEQSYLFTDRALGFSLHVTTPEGRFDLRIPAGLMARRKGFPKETGIPVLVCFDPALKAAPSYPLPEAFPVAQKTGLLTASQKETISMLDRYLNQKVPVLLREWKDFTEGTYVLETRRRFFNALTSIYEPVPGMERSSLEPGNFFDRAQRVRLRSLGQNIPGSCRILSDENGLRLRTSNCPISQLVDYWNRLSGLSAGMRLKAIRPDEEVNLVFETGPMTQKEAMSAAYGMLSHLPGVQPINP